MQSFSHILATDTGFLDYAAGCGHHGGWRGCSSRVVVRPAAAPDQRAVLVRRKTPKTSAESQAIGFYLAVIFWQTGDFGAASAAIAVRCPLYNLMHILVLVVKLSTL